MDNPYVAQYARWKAARDRLVAAGYTNSSAADNTTEVIYQASITIWQEGYEAGRKSVLGSLPPEGPDDE